MTLIAPGPGGVAGIEPDSTLKSNREEARLDRFLRDCRPSQRAAKTENLPLQNLQGWPPSLGDPLRTVHLVRGVLEAGFKR